MSVSAEQVRELREKTGAGMMDCKKALVETSGDFEKAVDYLRKKGMANAAKKAGREAKEGAVFSYIHAGGKIGVLVEICCETDFVARTEQFKEFAKDLCMQIAAAAPQWLVKEDVPPQAIEREKEIFRAQMAAEKKPPQVIEKILEGKISKFYSENCLMHQGFVKEPSKSIEDVVKEKIAALGENIVIRRFVRYVLGEK